MMSMQIYLAMVLAWAVVVGTCSSSTVSCDSCGPECQTACGTKNFRACCFNFLRRRRSYSLPVRRSQGVGTAAEWKALRGALMSPAAASRGLPFAQFLEASETDPAPQPTKHHRDPSSLASVLTTLLQDSSMDEEDEDEMLELEGEGGGEGIPEASADDATLSRLVAFAFHQPPPPPRSPLNQHYPAHSPPPPPPAGDVGK
ncbi:ras-associated and pleckstrin homology domains-containing protein 1-like isoform X2 [Portunus trituberculatus]|uniref:ras-associated and pleckstrin homology domains-containing protein 1-like isoform X2 n=1 Tax=Portunus trituberculatus TaxID=210409 RepID=UPI001E1CEA3F|nr:ras-associated and pleckstrin homology domains-containing protein 1-like isoform X2 [Portunus trituberculatus]